MLSISKTYEIITPESAEHGDFEETGFEFEHEQYSFKDLCDLIMDEGFYNEGSDWLNTVDPDRNYATGEETFYGLHFDRENKERNLKYWHKAIAYVDRQRKQHWSRVQTR
jgi:hypothetical protein